MVAGRKVARLGNELEYTQHVGRGSKHQEQTSSAQILSLKTNVKDMISVIEEMGNPFLDKDNDLYCLDTKIVMYP